MAKTTTMSGDRLFWGRPAQVRTARRFVVASLAARPVAVDRDVVALLVSELVTNAVVHSASGRADGTLLVGYRLTRDELDPKRLRLRVEVRDLGSPGYPRRCPHALESSDRRGLEVVEALASRWGVGRHPRGRVVWFELDLALADRGGGALSDRAMEIPARPPYPRIERSPELITSRAGKMPARTSGSDSGTTSSGPAG